MTLLERITNRVNRHGDVNDPSTPRPLLKLDEFFDGNDVVGSIGCNLIPTPAPAEFYSVLKEISARDDVDDVRVQVTMFDAPEWPFSDVVWVVTSADASTVQHRFPESLLPDRCSVGWPEGVPMEPCAVPPGMHPIACWWD
jgi:hypothetical protein